VPQKRTDELDNAGGCEMKLAQIMDIVIKALFAVVFFFVLQYFVLNAPLETSALWAGGMGIAAGYLAWSQSKRGWGS
jgi:hypothetical protein